MAFERWGHWFDGPYVWPAALQALPGVYVIWCGNDGNWQVLEVGEADNVRERVCSNGKPGCWKTGCQGTIYFSAFYTWNLEPAGRRQLAEKIGMKADPATDTDPEGSEKKGDDDENDR